MATNRKIILALSIVMMFALITVTFTFYVQSRRPSQLDPIVFEEMTSEEIINYFEERQSSRPTPMFYFIPVIGFSGLLVGSLVYYMLSEKFTRRLLSFQNRTGMPKVNRNELNSIFIPIPSIDEQIKIIEKFELIDEILYKIDSNLSISKSIINILINQFINNE